MSHLIFLSFFLFFGSSSSSDYGEMTNSSNEDHGNFTILDFEEDYDYANNRSDFFKPSVVVDQPVVSQYKSALALLLTSIIIFILIFLSSSL